MGIRLARNTGALHELTGQQWSRDPETGPLKQVHICCPACEAIGQLDERHAVAPDGRVTPAYSCRACLVFLDWVELEAWNP